MGRDTVQLETAVSTISQEYLLEFTSKYGISEDLYPELPGPEERIVDFLKGKVDMDLFNLIRAPNPTKVKTGTRPRAAHGVPLLTVTASRVIEMEDPAVATDSSRVPSTIKRSPLDFTNENPSQQSTGGNGTEDQGQKAVTPEVPPPENVATTGVAPEAGQVEEIAATGSRSTIRGKSLVAMGLGIGSTCPVPTSRDTPVDVSNPNPLSFADPQSLPTANVAQSLSRPGGSHSATREAKLLKKSVAQVARRDKRIQARENEIKNIETLLEAENYMKKAAEAKNTKLDKELENLLALFSDLQRYAEIDARLDAMSIDFDEELYPHMLTAIAGRRWVIRHGFHLAVIKCGESTELRQVFADVVSAGIAKGISEGLKFGVEHGKANLSLEAIEAYDSEAETKYIVALHALNNLKYSMVDQLESLKDAPIDVIMTSLHLEKVRDPTDPWACKEKILSADAIAANISRAEKKKKCQVICRTHGVSSAHHARSDGVSVSVPTVALQGLAILLTDVAIQTETSEDEASPKLLRCP
nr:transposase (putative), gypsy type [Tanacetum cinerariifolium]